MPNTSPWSPADADFPVHAEPEAKSRFLLRYATLAPSPANAQPWSFSVDGLTIGIHVERTRWEAHGFPDREMYASIGCVVENLAIAAEYFGFAPVITYCPDRDAPALAARVDLNSATTKLSRARLTELFQAMTERHTSRATFGSGGLGAHRREHLETIPLEPGGRLFFFDDHDTKLAIERLNDRVGADDPTYVLGTDQGGSRLVRRAARALAAAVGRVRAGVTPRPQGSTLRPGSPDLESPLFGIVCTTDDDPVAQVRAGQILERVFLTATWLALDLQPMTRALRIPALRDEVADLLPEPKLFPQILFRLGRRIAWTWDHTPRRPPTEFAAGGRSRDPWRRW